MVTGKRLSGICFFLGLASLVLTVLNVALPNYASTSATDSIGLWGLNRPIGQQGIYALLPWPQWLQETCCQQGGAQCDPNCTAVFNQWSGASIATAVFLILAMLPQIAGTLSSLYRAVAEGGQFHEITGRIAVISHSIATVFTILAFLIWNSARPYQTVNPGPPALTSFMYCVYALVIAWIINLATAVLAHLDRTQGGGYIDLDNQPHRVAADWPLPPYKWNTSNFARYSGWAAPSISKVLFYLSFLVAVVLFVINVTDFTVLRNGPGSALEFWRLLVLALLLSIVSVLVLRVFCEVLLIIFVWKDSVLRHTYPREDDRDETVDRVDARESLNDGGAGASEYKQL